MLFPPKLIILITGQSGAGKDHCAELCAKTLRNSPHKSLSTHVVSISDATKQEYAAATGTDFYRLITDRAFKEKHRPAMTAFYNEHVRNRPLLPQEHFLHIVYGSWGFDVLLITGMRDDAPVAAFSHLVPESRLVEVYVQAREETRYQRRGIMQGMREEKQSNDIHSASRPLTHCPTLFLDNDTAGNDAVEAFAKQYLTRFLHPDLHTLASMVRTVSDFPSPGIEFRHVLGISQQRGGLALCTSLLQTHFNGDWAKIGSIVCCEVGGLISASPLAMRVDVPLVLVRQAGKLPPPTISVAKTSSHISSAIINGHEEKCIEMERGAVATGVPVVVIDDVLATGETLCAVLELLCQAGVSTDDISIMVVVEFTSHSGRELLRKRGFGRVGIQSLLVLAGA